MSKRWGQPRRPLAALPLREARGIDAGAPLTRVHRLQRAAEHVGIRQKPDDLRPLFEDEFKALLREAYPADTAGRVVLPFRRIFVVARKPQGVPVP